MSRERHHAGPKPCRLAALAAAGLPIVLLIGGCAAPPPAEPALDTEQVGASPTDHLGPEGDRVARPAAPELIGVAPGTFPRDFPLYQPASVVDFGGPSPRYLHLRTSDSRATVERFLARRAPAAGWQRQGAAWRKGAVEVRVRLEQPRAGETLIVLEY